MPAPSFLADHQPSTVRHREWRVLRTALDELGHHATQIVEILGEPGSGKTRLLSALMHRARDNGVPEAYVRFDGFDQEVPYQIVSQLLNVPWLAEHLATLPAADRRLISRTVAAPPAAPADAQADRLRVRCAVSTLLASAARRGMLIIFDDVHWADEESLEILDHLVRRPLPAHVLLIIAQRPHQAPVRLRGTLAHGVELGAVRRIELEPLTREQSAELLSLPPDDERLAELHEAGRGIPLYLQALAATDGSYEGIPTQARSLLLGEIRALPPRAFQVAAAAAILGEYSDMEGLTAVTGFDREEVQTALGLLLRRDLLRAADRSAGLSFRHPLLRCLTYSAAEPNWRLTAHRRALKVLERRAAPAVHQAVHIERAPSYDRRRDLAVLQRAAEQSLAGNPHRAVRWLQLALESLTDDEGDAARRQELLPLLARALGMAGRLEESREMIRQVLRDTPRDAVATRVSSAALYAAIGGMIGNTAESLELISEELAAHLEAADPPAEVGVLIVADETLRALSGRSAEYDRLELALRLARRHRDRTTEAGALTVRALRDAIELNRRAQESLSEAALAVERLTDLELADHAEYPGLLGLAQSLVGLYCDADRNFGRAIAIARRSGHLHLLPALLLGLGKVKLDTGHVSEAARLARRARTLAERTGAGRLRGLALAVEALSTAWIGGELERQALQLAKEADRALTCRSSRSIAGPITLALVGHCTGALEQGAALLLEAGQGDELPRVPAFLRPRCFALIEQAACVTNRTPAQWAESAARAAGEVPLPGQWAFAELARGHARHLAGDADAAVSILQRAADLFGTAGALHMQAHALALAARAAAALGRRQSALSMLELAIELAQRCGAGRIREEAERQRTLLSSTPDLTRTGRPGRELDLGVLTERERQVAAFAGTGMRTREIAEQLSLSPRTVDVHLTRIYRKLNIGSRAALAHLLTAVRAMPDAAWAQPTGSDSARRHHRAALARL